MAEQNPQAGEHAPFCVTHSDDGVCLGQFDGPDMEGTGWNVYARPTRYPDGTLGVEVATVEHGGEITRLSVPVAAPEGETPR